MKSQLWVLIEQGDTPMVNTVTRTKGEAMRIAGEFNSEPVIEVEIENTEDAFELMGNEVSFVLQAIVPPGPPPILPIAHFSDGDCAELILFDDGSVYAWDEKGAVCVDKHGRVLSTYWRGDDEPFDIRQSIWHDTYEASELDAMVGDVRPLTWAMGAASYDAIHYNDERAPRAAARLVQLAVEAAQ